MVVYILCSDEKSGKIRAKNKQPKYLKRTERKV